MGYVSRGVRRVGGRRVVLALGGLYLIFAAGFPVTSAVGDRSADEVTVISVLVGASGLVLTYGGYRLSQTGIRPDLYHVVAEWCLRTIEVMVGILLFISLITALTDPLANFLILSALASVAGLGMGYHDGKAKTRAIDAEERSQELAETNEELKKANRDFEEANRELERYQTIVEAVDDGIYVKDEDGCFTLVNDAYAEMTGYDREELLGAHASLVVDEDIIATSREYDQQMLADGHDIPKVDADVQTADGGTIQTEATFAVLKSDGAYEQVGVVRDITERKERERQLERQNEQLDNFASLLAHEIRNPVAIGQIYSRQLPEEKNPQAVAYVREAFDRIEDIIDVILLVARGQEAISPSSPVELAAVARQAWGDIDAPEATLEVVTDLTTEVDETYIRHLFRNLFENAVEHGRSDVTVTVGDNPTGFYVADDGTGIPADERGSVFESGHTSAPNDGMGLGLTFVRKMADVYGWEYAVTDSADGGAQFEFENVTETPRVTE